MAGRAKYFELLDFPKFAYPALVGMDAVLTANNITERLGGGGFMSYGMIWARMNVIVGGRATDDFITTTFNRYEDDWKNNSIQEVVNYLSHYFGGRGNWYPFPMRPKKVLGFWFKPSIKGIWFVDGKAYAVLINARKGQPLHPDHRKFLARGVYELHCREDPNDPIPLILDVSEPVKGQGRQMRAFTLPVDQAISLQEFDDTVRTFMQALELAGVALPPDTTDSMVDIFKRP